MRRSAGIAALLVLSGLLPAGCGDHAASGRDEGDWVAFYTSSSADRSQYFYDRAGLRRGPDRLEARWKRVNAQGAISIYQIEIHCRARTFTERGTLIVEPGGQQREVPRAELWIDHPVAPNTSTDVFAQRFCPSQAPSQEAVR